MKFNLRQGFDKKLMLDTAIASLILNTSPAILRKLLPSLSTGTTGTLTAGGLTYLLGMLMKNKNISNIGLALAIAETVSNVAINPLINTVMPTGTNTTALKGYARLINTPQGAMLRDYTKKLTISNNYANQY